MSHKKTLMHSSLVEFHKAFGCSIGTTNFSDRKAARLRKKLIKEEFREVIKAFASHNSENLLKEIVDATYVLIGTAVAFGWDFDEAFRRVHASNMSKLGPDGKPLMRNDGKVLKSEHYSPPNLSDLVDTLKLN